MKKLFCFILALIFTTSFARASLIGVSSYTSSQPQYKNEPTSSHLSANTFLQLEFIPHTSKFAGVYWLPDYVENNKGLGYGDRVNDDDSNGDKKTTCSVYNKDWVSANPDTSKYDFVTKNNVDGVGLKCYSNIKCKTKFSYNASNCSGNYITSGNSCDGKFEACICKPEFKFNTTNCTGAYKLSGTSCNNLYTQCNLDKCYGLENKTCTYGCQKNYADCSSKCEACYIDNCRNRNDNKTDFGCTKYWTDCPTECETGKPCSNTCDSGYDLTACSATQTVLNSKSNQCKNTCYQCKDKGCPVNQVDLETCGWLSIFIR